MKYVLQSMGPDEEIVHAGRFHWIYNLQAVLWIVFGIVFGIVILYLAADWHITSLVKQYYPSVPPQLESQARGRVITEQGGYIAIIRQLHPGIRIAALGSFVMGVFFFANMMVIKATTEIAVTNQRLIYKQGLIARQTGELSVDRIEGVNVLQGILGRVFGYGRVSIRGMGVGEVVLPPIENPIVFRKAIQTARAS